MYHIRFPAAVLLAGALFATGAAAQGTRPLSLDDARRLARAASPELAVARELLGVAQAREAQAAAWLNPAFAWVREQTSGSGITSRQDIASFEQRLEIGGQRSARRAVAAAQREASQARLEAAQARLDYEVARAYAGAVAAAMRLRAAEQYGSSFERATRVSAERLAGGDISGFEHRRLLLEAARGAALRAEVRAGHRRAQSLLRLLIGDTAAALAAPDLPLADSAAPPRLPHSLDSIVTLALAHRADLRALGNDLGAARAEASLARRERIPTPALLLGLKREETAGQTSAGFVAGLSLPVPLWDRRGGAVAAADAEVRRRAAERELLRRQAVREITEAYVTQLALAEQLDTLGVALGESGRLALRSAELAYAEGEIPLIAWLDAGRAWQETEAARASVLAEYLISRAALERAAGVTLR